MDVKELRIGNHIIYEATTHVITSISDNGNCTSEWLKALEDKDPYHHNISELDSIILTKGELDKFEFQLVKGNDYYLNSYFLLDTEGHLYYHRDYTGVNIRTVHALQNFYFAITGEELKQKQQ